MRVVHVVIFLGVKLGSEREVTGALYREIMKVVVSLEVVVIKFCLIFKQ